MTQAQHWSWCRACERLIGDLTPDGEASEVARALVEYRWQKARYR